MTQRAARVLVTNDDGIDAPGILILTRALVGAGHEVRVIAPAENCSGAGASLGQLATTRRVDQTSRELPDLPQVDAIAVTATPAACTMLALLDAFGEYAPDVVVSGINAGANAGRAVIFSGTIGAAMTAAQFGVPGIAVSLAEAAVDEEDMRFQDAHYETAAALAVDLVAGVLTNPVVATYNLNVPPRLRHELTGVTSAIPAAVGTMQTVVKSVEANGEIVTEYATTEDELPPDSDTAQLGQGWATLSVLGRREVLDSAALVVGLG